MDEARLLQRQLDAVDNALGEWEPEPGSDVGAVGRVQALKQDRNQGWRSYKRAMIQVDELRAEREALEREVERLREALETIKRRINQYDDMDDATLLAWIEDKADRALSSATTVEES